MNKLDFQANSAQLMSQTIFPFRQGQITQRGFQQHFQAALSPQIKN
ncbi:hypothetical protein ACIQYG_15765 [Peribacillus sp. NPDC096622]